MSNHWLADQKRIDAIRRAAKSEDGIWICDKLIDAINEINELRALLDGRPDFEPSIPIADVGGSHAKANFDKKEYMREYMKKKRAEKQAVEGGKP